MKTPFFVCKGSAGGPDGCPGAGGVRARFPAGDSSGLYLLSTISQKVLHCARKSLKVCRRKFYLLSSMCHTEENTRREI